MKWLEKPVLRALAVATAGGALLGLGVWRGVVEPHDGWVLLGRLLLGP